MSKVVLGDSRAEEIRKKWGVDESTALKISRAEKETGSKVKVTSGHSDRTLDKDYLIAKEILDRSKKRNKFSPKVWEAVKEGWSNRKKYKTGTDAANYVKSQGGSKKAQEEVRRLRFRKSVPGTSAHTTTKSAVDISRRSGSKAINNLKEQGFREILEKDSKGRPTKGRHLQFDHKDSPMGEIRLRDESSVEKKLTFEDKLEELSKIDPTGTNTKENIEAVLENDPTKLVPQITNNTPRLAMLNLDEKLRRDKLEEEAKADLVRKQVGEQMMAQDPKSVKEVVKNLPELDSSTAREVNKDIDAKVKGKPRQGGVASQFTEALTFFLPQMIGGLVGGAIEGDEGAIAGMTYGGQMGDAFRKHQMDKEKLEVEKSKEDRLSKGSFQLSTMQDESGEAQVYRVNLATGEKEELGKKGYAKGYVKDPNTGFLINKQTGETLNLGDDPTNKTFFSALTPVQREQFLDSRKSFLTESKPMREAAAKVEGLISKQVDEAMVNSVAANQLGAQVASIYENGRLTDEDVLRYTRRTGIPDRVADIIKDLKHGTISASKAQDIKDALTVLRQVVIDQVNQKSSERAEQYAADWGLPKEDVTNAFWKKIEQPKKKAAMSKEAYLQAIKNASTKEEIDQIKAQYGAK